MRHGMTNRKLGRTSGHRAALFRNQLASMISHERIITTLPKAKELRPILEKIVTLSREDSVHNRRQAARQVQEDALVQKLFTEIAPRFKDRPGGYTRIVKLGPRRGDGAEMAILEFVDFQLDKPVTPTAKPAKKASAPKKEAKKPASEEGGEEPAKKPAKKPATKKAAPARKAAPAKKSASSSKKSAPKKGGSKGSKRGS